MSLSFPIFPSDYKNLTLVAGADGTIWLEGDCFDSTEAVLRTAGKIGIAVGAVVVTASQGVWSTNNEMGVKALDKVRSKVLPAANEIVEKIPSREAVKTTTCAKWNSGVKTVFSSLSTAPEKSSNYIRKSIQDMQK